MDEHEFCTEFKNCINNINSAHKTNDQLAEYMNWKSLFRHVVVNQHFAVTSPYILDYLSDKFRKLDSLLDELSAAVQVTSQQYRYRYIVDEIPYETVWPEEERVLLAKQLRTMKKQCMKNQMSDFLMEQGLFHIIVKYAIEYY